MDLASRVLVETDSFDLGDPESLLNTWLDELSTLSVGLENVSLRQTQMTSDLNTPRIDSYRFSMANLEESQDVDIDAILGELCALETQCDQEIAGARNSKRCSAATLTSRCEESQMSHSRSSSDGQRLKLDQPEDHCKQDTVTRTESPDNDSAFSDNVSMLSSESSASSGGSSGASKTSSGLGIDPHPQNETGNRAKAEKIRIALEKMKQAAVQKLFIKAFTRDGSTKSLLVDEKMTCGYVTRLLADKNHVTMEPKWAIVEHLPDLYMERVYEDSEMLVENLLMWTRDSKNKLLFHERPDKCQLFHTPEAFLLSSSDAQASAGDQDDHSRAMLLEEFFSSSSGAVPELSGPLYLKADSKKGWKRFQFVLRASGLYYYPKEKAKSCRDLVCLASFEVNQVYYGVGWRKKYKSPTDHCFAIKHPRLQQSKSSKYIKYLCADDAATLHKWVVGIRIAKHGRQLLENYRSLLDDLAQEDLDLLAHARSCSVASIAQTHLTATELTDTRLGYNLDTLDGAEPRDGSRTLTRRDSAGSRGAESRASSSSSSGCLSDGTPSSCEQGFECDFPSGTIKRKPSVNPKLPLTSITRQLKEVGEGVDVSVEGGVARVGDSEEGKLSRNGTLTRNSLSRQSWRRSHTSDDSGSNSGTLKRRRSLKKERKPVETLENRLTNGEVCKEAESAEEEAARLSLEEVTRSLSEAMNSLLQQTESIQQVAGEVAVVAAVPLANHWPAAPPAPECDFEEVLERNLENISDHASSFGDDDLKDDPLEEASQSEALPPPPSPSELLPLDDMDLSCSSLSLASLPPFPTHQTDHADQSDVSELSTPASSGGATPINALSPDATPTNRSPAFSPPPASPKVPPKPRSPLIKAPYYSQLDDKKPSPKKISFNFIPEEITDSPKKPLPPKRSAETKLTSPKRISSKESTLTPPPKDFLKDLQRVMRKKWQVAQKCKQDTSTTPHEVLGFRDPPCAIPDYKETNVSNWVQEHYGQTDNLYENVFLVNEDSAHVNNRTKHPTHTHFKTHLSKIDENGVYIDNINNRLTYMDASKKRPPPPPPKRSETTHLTTRN